MGGASDGPNCLSEGDAGPATMTATANEAAVLMYENDIGSVPVISGRKLKGIITDRDIVTRCIAKGKQPDKTKVSELMSTNIAFLNPDQTVHDAVSLMAEEKVRRLPVVKDGHLDGIVSLADIARIHSGPEIANAISEISIPNFDDSFKSKRTK